ncbi:MAG: ATP-binding cassette domain-containing protein [Propionibacteriaceae bacterium]|nr:ATP-binding cassette domain-containing protein [Propionibacteriaceae bacterium]
MTRCAAIETADLTFGYRRGVTVIDGLTQAIRGGEVTAITGRSGSGKSTLLYLLAGMLTPWSGSVVFDGSDLAKMDDHARSRLRAETFGFVFQDAALDPRRSVLDAVLEPTLYASQPSAKARDRALALLDLMGVDVPPESRPGEISGGQAQRVGVARALLLDPQVIFADEPTGNLDNASSEAVLGALTAAAEGGCTVIIATHDDRVVSRSTGRITVA